MFSHREQKCPSRLSPAERLDGLVWADLCELLSHPEQVSQAEYEGCPPRVVRGSALHAATASAENHTVRLPRAPRPASYSAQLVTRCRCFGMRCLRTAFALNGKRGAPGWWRGLAPASHYPQPPKRAIRATRRLEEKHGTKRRRTRKKLHLATDADTGRIVASALIDKDADDGSKDADDGSQVGPLLDQVDGSVAALTGDGAFDRDDVHAAIAARHPGAAVVVPPRSSAVPNGVAEAAPTQRDLHIRGIAERGRMGWQRASGYNWRALVESDVSRWERVIGDGLRSPTAGRQATEVAIAANALNRMLELGRPEYVRIA